MDAVVPTDPALGLSSEEARARRARGLGNEARVPSSRSYGQIVRENVLTFINLVIGALGVMLVALGRPSDALVSVGVIAVNVAVSLFQEIRAKRTLDRIAVLTRPKATLIRDGQEVTVDPAEIVEGDVLVLRPGDQVVADGKVVGDAKVDVDESLLTGESDAVAKGKGDKISSGSFAVSGSTRYVALAVGRDAVAYRLTSGARAFRRVLTPLQKEIALVVRVILLVAVYFEVVLAAGAVFDGLPAVDAVRNSTVVAGLVPNGLFLAIAVAYALGALSMVGKGVLVQQANAVESLSHVDVLCLDKTGTLTTNRLRFEGVRPVGVDEPELRRLLGDYVASIGSGNRTSEAIAAAFPGVRREVAGEVAFASARKWSAASFREGGGTVTHVLGAPEIVSRGLAAPADGLAEAVDDWTRQGLRVLLFARSTDPLPVASPSGPSGPSLPADLTPLGLVAISDELRPEARETLAAFSSAGVQLKLISGDNPSTVAALARQIGLDADAVAVSGLDLDGLDEEDLARSADEATVFGRIVPEQKAAIVGSLRARGRYVAMVGDGVNDVLSLKRANLGISVQSGSQAARAVADVVLLGDTFSALPRALEEGRRIVNGMQDILRLFLTRVFYTALLIAAVGAIGGFPFSPKENALLTLLTVGIPSIALAAWAQPAVLPAGGLVRRLIHFVLPATLTLGTAGIAVYLAFLAPAFFHGLSQTPSTDRDVILMAVLPVAQTALMTFSTFCGLLLVVFVEPPVEALVGGDALSTDWRPTALAVALAVLYLLVLALPDARGFFELSPLPPLSLAAILAAVALWGLFTRWVWRSRLVERFFDVDFTIGKEGAG